jgi:Rad3-related DNA helicase
VTALLFHPAAAWFERICRADRGADRSLAGDPGRPHVLIAAPTGSGKTLAAFSP